MKREKKTLGFEGYVRVVFFVKQSAGCAGLEEEEEAQRRERSRSSRGESQEREKKKEWKERKEIRNVCCSWGILKIKLTRLSSNDPQFRVTLQVSNPSTLYLPPSFTHGAHKL